MSLLATPDTPVQALQQVREAFLGADVGWGLLVVLGEGF